MALIARSVGVAEFGVLGVAIAVMSIAVILGDFGVSPMLVRSHATVESAVTSRLLLLSRVTTYILAILATAIGVLVALALGGYWWLVILVLALALEKNIEAQTGVLVAHGRVVSPAALVLLRRFSVLVATSVAFVWAEPWTLLSYCTTSLLAVLASMPIATFLVRAAGASKARRLTIRDLQVDLKTGSSFLVGNLSGMVRLVDIVIVSVLGGAAAAGIYSAGTKLASPLFLVPQSIASVVLPRAARGSNAQARADTRRLLLLGFCMVVVSAAVTPFAQGLIVLVYGPPYAAAWPVLVVTLLSFPAVALSSTLGSLLQGRGEERFVATNGTVNAISTFGLMIVGFFAFGIVGVAVGLLLGYVIKFALLVRHVWRLS